MRGLWGEASVTKSTLGPAGGFPRDPSYAARGLQHTSGVQGTPEWAQVPGAVSAGRGENLPSPLATAGVAGGLGRKARASSAHSSTSRGGSLPGVREKARRACLGFSAPEPRRPQETITGRRTRPHLHTHVVRPPHRTRCGCRPQGDAALLLQVSVQRRRAEKLIAPQTRVLTFSTQDLSVLFLVFRILSSLRSPPGPGLPGALLPSSQE